MQTQRLVWKYFQQWNVVTFVVSTCLAVAMVLPFPGTTQQADLDSVRTAQVVPLLTDCAEINPTLNNVGGSGERYDTGMVRQGGRTLLSTPAVESSDELTLFASECAPNPYQASALTEETDTTQEMHTVHLAGMAELLVVGNFHKARKHAPQVWKQPTAHHASKKNKQGKQKHVARSARRDRAYKHATARNVFPYGVCTWWANQRYYQLHGTFVPWGMNADALQWPARARDLGWRVSGKPKVGSIIVLQAGVQGAYGFGHVGVVERVLANGSVIASSMNWGANPRAVTQHQFRPGRGVTFVSQL